VVMMWCWNFEVQKFVPSSFQTQNYHMILFVIRLSHISSPHNSTIDYHDDDSDDGSRHVHMVSVFFFLFSFLFHITNYLFRYDKHSPTSTTCFNDGGRWRNKKVDEQNACRFFHFFL
jgi:hypothetical protein